MLAISKIGFQDSELVVAQFSSNKGGNLDIRIPRNFVELHPAPCMRVMCHMHELSPYVETKCFVSYSFNSVSEAHESKEGHL